VGSDFGRPILQIGAMYDLPSWVGSRSPCFSYSDGNLAEYLRSPFCARGLVPEKVERALAFERQVAQGMTLVFTMSDYLRRSFIRDYGVPEKRVVTVGAGINLDQFPEEDPDKRYDTQEVLFIGIDFPRKGGDTLLDAFRIARSRLPGAQLHIVGPRNLSIPQGLDGGVTVHGFLDKASLHGRTALADLFRRCSLFVLPSLYEPFGIAPLEAMANGLPSLVTNRWALAETVAPGETGEHVEPGAAEELGEKIVNLLANPDALQAMGQRARRMVRERYSWDKVARRLVTAAQQAIVSAS
jgi:glycosyltransferase involved in cell wall biosynthesis